MGTSTSFKQLAAKMEQVGVNIEDARRASFRQAARDMQPVFNRQARAAAGSDQRPSNARGRLSADFKVIDGRETSILYINPMGPWGLRDNTDIGGSTMSHFIKAKRKKVLAFQSMRTGGMVFAKSVWHPGSVRDAYWGEAREESFDKIRKRLPEDVIEAIEAALSGSGFKSRS